MTKAEKIILSIFAVLMVSVIAVGLALVANDIKLHRQVTEANSIRQGQCSTTTIYLEMGIIKDDWREAISKQRAELCSDF